MKKHLIYLIGLVFCTFLSVPVSAKDVYVNGYYRKNGTYVQPHYRSSPDAYKWNNYGSSTKKNEGLYNRDKDGDGISNQNDYDDNNNGVHDDNE